MIIAVTSRSLLAEQISGLDLRCGGRGTCGRCRVLLLAGTWNVDGNEVTVGSTPVTARACRTYLLSSGGEVEIPDTSLLAQRGRIAAAWTGRALPNTPETVIAADIGTTTIAVVKICGGEIVAAAAGFNSQSRFGDNVVSRISYAGASAAGLQAAQKAVVASLDELLQKIGIQDTVRLAVAGNTVMSCLFHGIDPSSIGVMPFTPPCTVFPVKSACELGFSFDIPVYTVPAISGYIGGDLTAGLGETGLHDREMLVDIGTNCEIIFNTGSATICTAAAAGPAFEGAGIACGLRAIPGAIDHYYGPENFSVLENTAPCGLCGSAMIDFLAVERTAGRLNEFGRFVPAAASQIIAPGIELYESDIAQLLKAKAAVRAGIRTLEEHCGQTAEKIYLAGGFARYLQLANAVAIDMLPERTYELVGNTSLGGAARLACTPEYAAELETLSAIPREIPLNVMPEFEDNFIDALMLP